MRNSELLVNQPRVRHLFIVLRDGSEASLADLARAGLEALRDALNHAQSLIIFLRTSKTDYLQRGVRVVVNRAACHVLLSFIESLGVAAFIALSARM